MIQIKWYLRPMMVFLAILLAGPLAMPLIWMSPAFRKWQKVLITVSLVLLTFWFVKLSVYVYQSLIEELKKMDAILGQ